MRDFFRLSSARLVSTVECEIYFDCRVRDDGCFGCEHCWCSQNNSGRFDGFMIAFFRLPLQVTQCWCQCVLRVRGVWILRKTTPRLPKSLLCQQNVFHGVLRSSSSSGWAPRAWFTSHDDFAGATFHCDVTSGADNKIVSCPSITRQVIIPPGCDEAHQVGDGFSRNLQRLLQLFLMNIVRRVPNKLMNRS